MANEENVSLQRKENPERARGAHLALLRSQSEHLMRFILPDWGTRPISTEKITS